MAARAYDELRADEAAVWDRFYAEFAFRPRVREFPAIKEPAPSVTWSLASVDDSAVDRLAEVVHEALATLAGSGSVLALDWQHPCYRVWPSRIGPDTVDPPASPGWPLSPYPDGDYFIYLAEDFRFGTFGHPWELSLCVFGAELLRLTEVDLHELLGDPMRRTPVIA
ncbi:DUF2716 domain-containing protein [Asanoa iriomotensis]|uniref:DUF2716 domain-containing protein n=1 Tax=Asanoa iriomotensis TaxID=234613 RepID=A0ABQ4C1U5_9ACTN|nr:DUF2716 domain-containing protein [Asanoa iriomotensis]GIF56396.1 hypothetical protein Air01nite_24910 [Asanoa iriomotensis]